MPHDRNKKEFVDSCQKFNREFLEKNKNNICIEYLRNRSDEDVRNHHKGAPIGVMLAYLTDDGSIKIGWSLAKHAKKNSQGKVVQQGDAFIKPVGLWKAIRRAMGVEPRTKDVPFSIERPLFSFALDASEFFYRKEMKNNQINQEANVA